APAHAGSPPRGRSQNGAVPLALAMAARSTLVRAAVKSMGKMELMLGTVVVLGLGGWLLARYGGGERAHAAPEIGKSEPGGQNPVPVFATAAKAEDVPIILRGIGSVAA